MIEATLIHAGRNEIGEGPVWNAAEGALYWVDCVGRRLYRRAGGGADGQAGGAVREWALRRMPGSYAFRADGTILMASRNGLALLDLEAGTEREVEAPAVDFARERFNDGACDRLGRFWVGSMERTQSSPTGGLFRVTPDLAVRRMDEGVTVANGIAWSPDGRTMYFADSRAGVYAYDFDLAAGEVANRRLFLPLDRLLTFPDGLAVDREGGLWVAEPGSSGVHRYMPDGRRERSVRLPVGKPASCAFGGEGLDTLFVTTLRHRIAGTPEGWEPTEADGGLFAAVPGVVGLPEPLFAAQSGGETVASSLG